MEAASAPQSHRIAYLDSLRGIAAMIVVWGHFENGYGNPLAVYMENNPLHLLVDGFAAVSFFFVLSGFVLSARYLTRDAIANRTTPSYLSFCVMRFFRIMIPLIAVMAISYIVMALFYNAETRPGTITKWLFLHWEKAPEMDLYDFFKDWILFAPGFQFVLVPQAWTLFIEIIFSLFVPFLILLTQRSSLWLIIFVLLVLRFSNMSQFIVHFTLGVLIARHLHECVRFLGNRSMLVTAPLWVVAVVLLSYRYPVLPGLPELNDRYTWIATGLGSALLILMIAASNRVQSFFSQTPLVYLGKISYSVYLCHMFVLLGLVPPLLDVMGIKSMNEWPSALLAFSLSITITVLVASFSYRWIEVPAMSMGRKLAKRLKQFA